MPTRKYKSKKGKTSKLGEVAIAYAPTVQTILPGGELSNESIVLQSIEGVAINRFDEVASAYNISSQQLAYFLGISERTIRNYRDQDRFFDPKQGEQLLKIQKLMALGSEVFGGNEAFQRWLQKPAYGLDHHMPSQLLITSEGVNLVIAEVQRIAYGDFS